MRADLVLRGGTVHDGGGGTPVVADVAVQDGRIAAVTDPRSDTAIPPGADEIDARGLLVTPGFFDIHSHSDFTLLVDPRAVSAVHQGVTCEVIGNCGFGCFPIRDLALSSGSIYGWRTDVPVSWHDAAGYLERLEAARPAVNVATLVPNGQLRLAAIGMADRAATSDELAEMTKLLESGLEAGAWGYSTGLEYPAETAASEAEIATLCGCVARRGGYYATHTRDRDDRSVEAVEEAIRAAQSSGVRLQVSHIVPRNGRDAGERCIAAVEHARARGVDVGFDMHTRLFGTTYLSAALPPWAAADGPEALRARLADPAARRRMATHRSILTAGDDWGRVMLMDNDAWPGYARRSLADVAADRGQAPYDALCALLLGAGDESPMVLIDAYTEAQQHDAFAHELCVPASDATTLAPDGPLASSAFHGAYTWAAWFWRAMVRETRRLDPAQAVHKLTGLPASTLGLADRGRLARGARADIAVFDPAVFGERGTRFAPNRLAAGMCHVVVNGRPALRDGVLTGDRAGQVLRFPG